MCKDCSLTITDDKSVSRKHATLSCQLQNNPILTDCNSKFGTFVNGNAVKADFILKNGDTVKFGGAETEFVVEKKDFSVFISKSLGDSTDAGIIKSLAERFGFPLVEDVSEAAYFVLNDNFTGEMDSHLVSALLQAKYIVSPAYFTQLKSYTEQNSNFSFSLALIQPALVSKLYPMDCWIPQKSRLQTFKSIFEGIKRFVVFENEYRRIIEIVQVFAEIVGGIEVKVVGNCDALTFNELLIHSDSDWVRLNLKVNIPTRSLAFPLLLSALIRNDRQLAEINVIYPEVKEAKVNTIVEESRKEVIEPISKIKTSIEPKTTSFEHNTLNSVESNIPTRSLTTLLPMPANLLRPSISHQTSIPKPTKFVKCYPKHRQPGIIPALIGPDQLNTLSRPVDTIPAPTGTDAKRRVLIKDSWLAEDDFVEEGQKQTEKPVSKPAKIQAIQHEPINPAPTTTNSIPNTQPIASKFQSAFFKNLTKGK